MTYSSSRRRPERRPTRRTNRRLQTTAGALARPAVWQTLWQNQRASIFVGALGSLIAALLMLLFGTDLFYAHRLDISGNHYLSTGDIETVSGIKDYSIFFVDPRAVEDRLEKLPEVKSANVSTRLPNQVSLTITERNPEIVWARGNETYWVDSDGVVLSVRANLPDLPRIQDLDQTVVRPGGLAPQAATDAFWALRAAWLSSPRSFEWSTARGLAFTDEHGWKIYLGGAEDMAGKLFRLRALTPELINQKPPIQFIDLGKGEPYYR